MSEFISGIRPISPTYPLKPVQPAQKDRETGQGHKKNRPAPADDDSDDESKPTIDEHV